MNKSSNNNEKIKVESGYADSLICKLEESNVRFELGPSKKIEIDGETVELQTIYIDLNTVSKLRKPRKSDGIHSHSKMEVISKYYLTLAKPIFSFGAWYWEYTLSDVIAEVETKEEALTLLEMINKTNPLYDVIVAEHYADAEITSEIQLAAGKTYWSEIE